MVIKLKQIAAMAAIFALSNACFAIGPGYYYGLGVGTTAVHAKKQTFLTPNGPASAITVSPSTNGIGERLFMGYDINPYAGIEGGFAHYGTATYKIPAEAQVACNNPTIRQNGFDLQGKGKLPVLNTGVSLVAKFGMAVVYAGSSGSLQNNTTGNNACSSNTSSKAAVRPMYGVGASYDLSQRWVSDISWSHINGGGNVQPTDFVAISVSYHLTDTYCGQFLC